MELGYATVCDMEGPEGELRGTDAAIDDHSAGATNSRTMA